MLRIITISLPNELNVTTELLNNAIFDTIVHIIYMREQIPENYEMLTNSTNFSEKPKLNWLQKLESFKIEIGNSFADFGQYISKIHIYLGNSVRSAREKFSITLPTLRPIIKTSTKSSLANILKRNLCNYWSEVSDI